MKQQNEKMKMRLDDWKLWFRLGTIGFLLLLASRVEGRNLQILSATEASPKQSATTSEKATLKIKTEKNKKSLPVLIAPSEKKEAKTKTKPPADNKKPAEAAPMPVIVPQQKSKTTTKQNALKKSKTAPNAVKSNKKKAPQAKTNTEKWSILITPGVSSRPNVKSKPSVTTFQLDHKTKKMVAPPIHHDLSDSPKRVSKNKTGELEMISPPKPSSSTDDAELPVIQPKKRPIQAEKYEQIYNSIPYSRAEYLANPAYRHEATMEMLFGTLRPTVIHKQDKPKRVYNQPRLNEAVPRTSPPPMPFGYYPGYYGGYYPGYYRGYYPNYYPGYYRGYYGGYGGYYGGYGYRGGYRPYSSLNRYGHTRYGYRYP